MKKILYKYEISTSEFESLIYSIILPTDNYEVADRTCCKIFEELKRQCIFEEDYLYLGIVSKQEI